MNVATHQHVLRDDDLVITLKDKWSNFINDQVEDWKQIWVPAVVKEGIPGEKYLGKDEHGHEYTAHDVWRKKMIWKPQWKKVWKTKQVEAFKTEKVEEWKVEKVQDWKIEKKQDWVSVTKS